MKMLFGATVRGEGGIAGEGKLVGIPKFHSWGKCTMTLMNIQSDWMSNAFSGLCVITYTCTIYLRESFSSHLDLCGLVIHL